MSCTIKIVIRKKKLSDGSCPLALRITQNRKSSFIHLGKSISENLWDAKSQRVKKSHPNSAKLNIWLIDKLKEYHDQLLDMERVNQDTSSQKIKTNIRKGQQVNDFFGVANEYLIELKENSKLTRYSGEAPRIKILREYVGNTALPFQEITPTFLKKFSTYLTSYRQVSERTTMNYMVVIRTIYNRGIKNGLVDRKYYPFGNDKIQIKFPQTIKIGLSEDEVKKIEAIDLQAKSPIWHARNVWLTSFYLAGIRISDVLRLKWNDIIDERLVYRMNKNQKVMSLKIPQKVLDIIRFYETSEEQNEKFIFPELAKSNLLDPGDVLRKSKTAAKKFNKYLGKLALMAGINKKLTNHIARHSFGNISGEKISPQMLQKLYRHSDLKTTIGYQANFIHKDADEALEKVLDF